MKRVAELEGAELDYWVALAHGWVIGQAFSGECWKSSSDHAMEYTAEWAPSTDWVQTGQIFERERISLTGPGAMGAPLERLCSAYIDTGSFAGSRYWFGPTPLIAAMRAFVASKFGEKVDEVMK